MSIIVKLSTFIPTPDGSHAMVAALMALDNGDELECAGCAGKPNTAATVQSAATGKHYGYALCTPCSKDSAKGRVIDKKLSAFERTILGGAEWRAAMDGDTCAHCKQSIRADEFTLSKDGLALHGYCIADWVLAWQGAK